MVHRKSRPLAADLCVLVTLTFGALWFTIGADGRALAAGSSGVVVGSLEAPLLDGGDGSNGSEVAGPKGTRPSLAGNCYFEQRRIVTSQGRVLFRRVQDCD